jgi:hypothetical protein
MRASRLLLATAIVGAVAVSGIGAAVEAAPKQPCGGGVQDAGNGWQALRPNWTSGPNRITQVVAVPYVPDKMYATNGSEVLQTDNAGCSWHLPTPPPSGGSLGVLPAPLDDLLRLPSEAQVVAIAAPSSATASDRVYIAWNDKSSLGTVRPHITVLGTNGTTEAKGLPRFGSISEFELSASDSTPTTAFTVVDPQLGGQGGLFRTVDGGANWVQSNATMRSSTITHLRVDPNVATFLYGLGPSGLMRSQDGGKSFQVAHAGGDIDSFDVAGGMGSSLLVAGHSSRPAFDLSLDLGRSWTAYKSRVAAKSVAQQPILNTAAVSDANRLYLETDGSAASARNITPGVGAPLQTQFTAPSPNGYAIVALHGDVVLRAVRDLNNLIVQPTAPGRPVVLLPHGVPRQFPSTLTPAKTTVTLPAGGHENVTYRLLLPRTPSPVDIMFLVDSTASTDKTINGLKQDLALIVNDLAATGLDVQFGLADFKDYSPRIDNIGDGELGDYPYRLDRRVGPSDASLRAALNNLKAHGGGDPAESQLTALYQSTTGAGQHYPGRRGYIRYLAPGDSAGYRPAALKLAVLATDERFHHERSYLTPTWARTVSALRSHGVHPIGLAVQTVDDRGAKHGFHSYKVEQQLAIDTGSLAPPGGVDCNGDLVPDVTPGAPFVCKVPVTVTQGVKIGNVTVRESKVLPVKLASAITQAAVALPDLRTVALQFAGAPARIASVVAPSPLPQVNVKNDNSVGFTVRYDCPRTHHAKLYHLHVNAAAGPRVVASAPMRVSCGAIPLVHHHPALPPAAVAAPVAAAAAAPPAPGQPVPNANPNPNPALNANVGFASQEEEQRQLAFAGADSLGSEEDASVEFQMSRLNSRDDGSNDPWLVGGAAVLLTGAAGYAARSRFAAAWHQSR